MHRRTTVGSSPRGMARGLARRLVPLGASLMLTMSAGGVLAQQPSTFDGLLLKLKEKGVLSEDEYEALKQARDEEISDQRTARRKQALKEAQQAEKDEKAKEAAATQTKIVTSSSMRSLELFGDVRLRFESRTGETYAAPGVTAAEQARERWRYAVRVGIRGDLTDDWYYGLRLDTSTNPRSSWVTFGDDTTGSPSSKTNDGIQVGQAYLGWKPTAWLNLEAGKTRNPFYTTWMVWDPDIMPEGLVEKFNFNLSDQLSMFGNFGQILYQDVNPDQTTDVGTGFHKKDAFMLGWQGGLNYKFGTGMSLKAAVSYYNYVGLGTGSISGPFKGQPGGNQVGINNLEVLNVPVEWNFPLFRRNAKLYGDFAMNLAADDRARAAGFPAYGDENKAYQLGSAYGELKQKGNWEMRAYWQRVQQYALDPNLTDSDWFDGRMNMQGWFIGAGYNVTDAIIAAARYGKAKRLNKMLGTGGSSDLTLNPLDDYQLLQVDLIWRF